MHTAPPVDYPLGRSRFLTFALLVVFVGVLIADVAWLAQPDISNWRVALAVCTTLVSAAASLYAWRNRSTGSVRWDGRSWWWLEAHCQCAGSIDVHLDIQGCLLLRFRAESGGHQWFWVDRAFAPPRWMALRRAVHASRRLDASVARDADALPPAQVNPPRRW